MKYDKEKIKIFFLSLGVMTAQLLLLLKLGDVFVDKTKSGILINYSSGDGVFMAVAPYLLILFFAFLIYSKIKGLVNKKK